MSKDATDDLVLQARLDREATARFRHGLERLNHLSLHCEGHLEVPAYLRSLGLSPAQQLKLVQGIANTVTAELRRWLLACAFEAKEQSNRDDKRT